MGLELAVIVISLIFAVLFLGVEMAFISSNKLQIDLQNKQGLYSGRILASFLKKPSNFIGTTLVGNVIALAVYGIFMAKVLQPILQANLPPVLDHWTIIFVIQTLFATLLVLVITEFLPKSFFLLNPNRLLTIFAFPMLVVYYLLYPVVFIIVRLSKFIIVRIFRLKYSEDKPVFGLTDLNNYFKNPQIENIFGEKAEVNARIFNNALEFKTVRVRECMIPRTEIKSVDIEDSIADIKKIFIESGHSKILVYRDSIDDVIGYCHSMALFKKPGKIEDILTPIIIVPETMLANELMIQFISGHKSLALVVDEFGGTSGIVSIEDIIEEIFGEIQDEYDAEDLLEQKIDDNNYLINARQEIDYLNEKYNWGIPLGDYDTLGGYILSVTENIPNPGDIIEILPFTFTIVSMKENRIHMVRVYLGNA